MADRNSSREMWIPLGNGGGCLIDAEDLSVASDPTWRWRKSPLGYAIAGVPVSVSRSRKGQVAMMHRLIAGAEKGDSVDHLNGDRLDNRRCNLRVCTHAENMRNRRSVTGKSKYKGVTIERGGRSIRAEIRCNGVCYKLGRFPTEADAARAYDAKAIELHGEFACTNADLGLLESLGPQKTN